MKPCAEMPNVLYCAMTKTPHSIAAAKRLSPVQWASIVDLYELGEKTQRQLAAQFDVSVTAIQKGLKKSHCGRDRARWGKDFGLQAT